MGIQKNHDGKQYPITCRGLPHTEESWYKFREDVALSRESCHNFLSLGRWRPTESAMQKQVIMITISRSPDYHGRSFFMMNKRDLPPGHPGHILLEDFLVPMKIPPCRLAESIGVPLHRINEIYAGTRAISSKRLGWNIRSKNSGPISFLETAQRAARPDFTEHLDVGKRRL